MKDMIYKTYDEWLKDGYQVLKGSKAIFINGEAKFSEQQVENIHELFLMRLTDEFCDPNL